MKKNKGFTLIELLAVIVVLAIIALIATPIVMNTIKSSKKGAAEQSGESYIKQVETSIMEYRTKTGNMVPDGTYEINSEGNLEGEGLTEPLKIEMNGTKPSDGEIVIENGMVKRDASTMTIGNYTVTYNETSKSYVAVEKSSEPESPYLCQAVTELSTQKVYDEEISNDINALVEKQVGVLASEGDPYAYGVEYSCNLGDGVTRTFYVLEDGDTTTLTEGRIAQAGEVSLIMNMNIDENGKGTTSGSTVVWLLNVDNSSGPVTALEYLESSTKGWTKLNPSQISLPSAYQIAAAGGDTKWLGGYYFYTGNLLSLWLTGNFNYSILEIEDVNDFNNYIGPCAYWTSTRNVNRIYTAWVVNGNTLYAAHIDELDEFAGVRPVITISKTQLN